MKKLIPWVVCGFAFSASLFGQAGTGTITGIVTDMQGAVVAGASIEVKNAATGQNYTGATSGTGNYSISQLPPGTYELTIKSAGFKTYDHKNMQVQAAQILRQDAPLEIGTTGETVTVTAEATMLRTESGDLATNISVDTLDNLPILGIGTSNSGSSGVRNPYNMLQLLPGVGNYTANSQMVINGIGGFANTTETFRVEGQDATNHLGTGYAVQENQPSADAIQEVAVQVSNYAPEFGTAGAAVLNITMKSGSNQFHGSIYDYFVNEDLNAGYPFSYSSTGGGKFRPRNRRNDYGGTFGGPLRIPKFYDGRNRTFFFFNFERYQESNNYGFGLTVPNAAYRTGDFSAISPNGTCALCSTYGIQTTPLGVKGPGPNGTAQDPLERPLLANTIYDPLTRGVTASGLGYANPFMGNKIPLTRLDPTAIAMQKLFPATGNDNLTSNASGDILGHRVSQIPSIKIDESVTPKDKLSFYFSKTATESQIASPYGNADGLPEEIGAYRGTFIYAWTYRLNYDRPINPTTLLHLGAGYEQVNFGDHAPFLNFNPSDFGLSGFEIHRQFPAVTGMMDSKYGGMQNIGTAGQIQTLNREQRPTFNANLTKVSGSHTFKFGGEAAFQGNLLSNYAGVTLATGVQPTQEPYTNPTGLNGFNTGFGYASFLLGDYNTTTQTPQRDYRLGKAQWAFFVQDSWKVTRKLTVDYGIRYDLGTPTRETYGRYGEFAANIPNANAGGRLGATQYANTCHCDFYAPAYPYAIGPRLGIAYQIDSKTVLRAGWGVVYQYTSDNASGGIVGSNAINSDPSVVNGFVNTQQAGFIQQPVWPVTDPSVYPNLGTTTGAPVFADRNYYRPPRQNQWSIGFQREITRNLVAEASYVANRDVWIGGPLGFLNQVSPAQYAAYGLYPYPGTGPAGYDNYSDYQLLSQPINSAKVMQKMAAAGVGNGGLLLPYATATASTTKLSTALENFPQFPALGPTGSATGDERYDSLQAKVTKRFSHGLQAGGSFTWEKTFLRSGRQDFFNADSAQWALQNLPPRILNFNFTYTTPKLEYFENHAKWFNKIFADWQIGGYANYQSGSFIQVPLGNVLNFLSSQETRVPGKPLYLKDPNGNINPFFDQVLNPAAWANPGKNEVGTANTVYYEDFRNPRHPIENGNIARNFRIKERFVLQFRGEFVNLFNRTELPNFYTSGFPARTPNSANALTRNASHYYTGGFGIINAYTSADSVPSGTTGATAGGTPLSPRSGTLVLRLTF